MTIVIGSDHGGFRLKEEIIRWLEKKNFEFVDIGTHNTDSVDYPDVAERAAKEIQSGRCQKGILVCGTGIGIGIAANKNHGIRAALCHDVYSAQKSREHNDANVLTLGERVIGVGHALLIVEEWLKSDFEGGRHQRRVDKVGGLEKKYEDESMGNC